MGRTSRAFMQQGILRGFLIAFLTPILLNVAAAIDEESDSTVDLRNGAIPLKGPNDVAAAIAAAASANGAGNSGGGGAGTSGVGSGGAGGNAVSSAAIPYGKDKAGRKLILLRYNDDSTIWQLRSTLLSAGTSILEYVAYNTLLVQAKGEAISAAAKYNALAAEYAPAFRVAPETSAVFKAAAAAVAAKASAQKGRRRLANSGKPSAGGAAAGISNGRPPPTPPPLPPSSPPPKPLPAADDPMKAIRGRAAGAAAGAGDTTSAQDGSESAIGALKGLGTWRKYVQSSQLDNGGRKGPNAARSPPPPPPSTTTGGNGTKDSAPELYAASIRLVPDLSDKARRTIATAWPKALGDTLGRKAGDECWPQGNTEGLYSRSSPILVIFLCVEDYETGVTFFTKLDTVMWVEPVLEPSMRNAIAGWILQTGNISTARFDDPTSTLRPYWKANIQGQGIIVGLEDTGLDMSHCNFIDDRWRTGSLRTLFVGTPPRLYLPNHRKVVQYMLPISSGINAWFGDHLFGHGTHTAGSIAGAVFTANGSLNNTRATGSAPKARLSFFDLSAIAGMALPSPIDDKMLPYHYAVGARISSSSWSFTGALAVSYNEASRQFDAFAWRNPDFLSVLAVGNDGDNGFMPTVTAPATAKNVLSVGATINHPKDYAASPHNMAILFRYTSANGSLRSYSMWPYLGTTDFLWRSLLYDKEVPFRVASPLNGCTKPTANYTGAVVLVDLSGTACIPEQRAINVRSAGAVAVLFIAAGNGFLDYSEVVKPDIMDASIIYGVITRAAGLNTVALLNNTNLNITKPHMTFITYPKVNVGIDSVAYFSSYGPLQDGRYKPDIVAPGGPVESAASGPGVASDASSAACSSTSLQMQGTSMATPLVAGHLALARQYFRDGYYPLGTAGDPASVGFEPSGMLLKAAAIVGARSMAGGYAANVGFNLGAAPDGVQGWGRLDLSLMLPLPNVTSPYFRVSVADFGLIDQGDWIYLQGIEATGTGPITAALVWHDYPASGAAKRALVNDLDFGYVINGSPYIRNRTDNVNNVERVEFGATDLVAGDKISLVVYGRSLRSKLLTGADAQLPQRWAVVVAGHFNGTLRTPFNPAYVRPQRFLQDTQVTLGFFNSSTCVYVRSDSAILSNGGCTTATANFTLVEEAAPVADPSIGGPKFTSDYGFLYTIRDMAGRCLVVPGNVSGTRAVLAPCNATDPAQKIGLFKSSQYPGSFYFLVPSFAIRSTGATPRCLKQTSASFVVLVSCNDDDTDQLFELRSAAAWRPPRVLPPSPQPPLPAPQAPAQQWYPYSLVFRTDWYPIGGQINTNDYDYLAGHSGYGDYTHGNALDDMDIIVSWTWEGVTYSMGRRADNENITAITGVEYGGDNTNYGTQYEIVFFQAGLKPPPTAYHVCVAWQYTQTPKMRVDMSVYRGYVVSTATKIFDTTLGADNVCSPTAGGFVGTYDMSVAAPPPAPPRPPAPQPLYPPYPLLFRTDWAIISGMRGRPTKMYDFDIYVTWKVGNISYCISSFVPQTGGGLYGGDNLRNNGTNYEIVYWPIGAVPPPTNTFHVCVRWNGNPKPLAKVTLSVYQGGRVTQSSKMIDTTLEWSDVCEPGAIGYIDSYWLGVTRGLLDDLSYSDCYSTPAPSTAFSLYFLARWTAVNATNGAISGLFDWDLVVTWKWQGETYEVSPYSRFVSGAIHGGDNMRLPIPQNSEAVYWPTGLTGIEPSPTQYDVCVRWFSAGRLNVTLTGLLYNNVVLKVTKVWDGSTLNSKGCSPMAAGYLGSYTYTGVAALQGRRSATEMVDGGDENPASEGGPLTLDDLARLVP